MIVARAGKKGLLWQLRESRVAIRERRAASNGDISGYYGSIHHPPPPNSKLMSSEREREKMSEDTLEYSYRMHTLLV